MREKIKLECTKCRNRNYTTTKNKNERGKLKLKKYCSSCNEHTVHKEV